MTSNGEGGRVATRILKGECCHLLTLCELTDIMNCKEKSPRGSTPMVYDGWRLEQMVKPDHCSQGPPEGNPGTQK